MPTERTLVLIKPDALESGWADDIKKRYRGEGLSIVESNLIDMSKACAREFYREHEGKRYYAGLYLAMSSGPSVALILEGDDAIVRVRAVNGATDPAKAEPGTIRHDFRSAGGPFNTVHASDSEESVRREIAVLRRFRALP